MVTIKDIAKEADVAISTVSNVLNGINVVSEETRLKVTDAVDRLGYIPNLNGKYLKSNRSSPFLGLSLTNMSGPYYSDLVDAVYQESQRNNYGLTIHINSTYNVEETIRNILGKHLSGAIILNDTINEQHVELLKKAKLPIVFIDREVIEPTMSSIIVDDAKGTKTAVEYLLRLGHRNIGYIHGYPDNYDDIERFKGYKAVLSEYGFDSGPTELYGYFSEQGAYNAVRGFITSNRGEKSGSSKMPSAFFAANDLMAIGCINALREEGFKVPEDVSVVGFDNIQISQYITPSLTTVKSPITEWGTRSVQKLVKMINGEPGERIKLDTQLVVRESCNYRINKSAINT